MSKPVSSRADAVVNGYTRESFLKLIPVMLIKMMINYYEGIDKVTKCDSNAFQIDNNFKTRNQQLHINVMDIIINHYILIIGYHQQNELFITGYLRLSRCIKK